MTLERADKIMKAGLSKLPSGARAVGRASIGRELVQRAVPTSF
jgi:hypothetical protein